MPVNHALPEIEVTTVGTAPTRVSSSMRPMKRVPMMDS
jgi:hypothetical protein